MKMPLALLIAPVAFLAAIGIPGLTAVRALSADGTRTLADVSETALDALPFVFVSGDEEDGEYRQAKSKESDSEDCGDDDEGGVGCTNVGNPAPAGTVPPPKNGLFGNGAPPQVQMN